VFLRCLIVLFFLFSFLLGFSPPSTLAFAFERGPFADSRVHLGAGGWVSDLSDPFEPMEVILSVRWGKVIDEHREGNEDIVSWSYRLLRARFDMEIVPYSRGQEKWAPYVHFEWVTEQEQFLFENHIDGYGVELLTNRSIFSGERHPVFLDGWVLEVDWKAWKSGAWLQVSDQARVFAQVALDLIGVKLLWDVGNDDLRAFAGKPIGMAMGAGVRFYFNDKNSLEFLLGGATDLALAVHPQGILLQGDFSLFAELKSQIASHMVIFLKAESRYFGTTSPQDWQNHIHLIGGVQYQWD
jgi:hypothetical protein